MSRLNSFSTSLPVAQSGLIPNPAVLQQTAPVPPAEPPSITLSPDQLQVAASQSSEGPAAQVSFAPPEFINHTVRQGQTLSDIAGEHLGNRNRYMEIFNVNRDQLSNPDNLRIGMALKVYVDQPSATPETPASAAPPEPPTHAHHRVRRGENLSDIAQKFLGDRNRYMEIYDMNRSRLSNPNDLRIGMVLDLPLPAGSVVDEPEPVSVSPPVAPAPPTAPAADPVAPTRPTPRPEFFVEHTVKRGESLSELALTYLGDGERYMDIFNANRDQLSTPDALKLGMKLKIPSATPPVAGTPASSRPSAPTVGNVAPVTSIEGMTPRATELFQAMQRYQQYHAQRGNTQRTRTTQAQMREIAVELDKAGNAFNVDPKMMLALFAHESGGINPRARSHTGAGGLGQLTGIAIRQIHHMSGIAKGFRGEAPYNQYKGNFVQSTRNINQRYDIKANVWTSTAYMSYELTDRAHLGRGVERALKRYGDPNVPTYANKVNAEYKTLFGGRLF